MSRIGIVSLAGKISRDRQAIAITGYFDPCAAATPVTVYASPHDVPPGTTFSDLVYNYPTVKAYQNIGLTTPATNGYYSDSFGPGVEYYTYDHNKATAWSYVTTCPIA